MEYSCIFFLTMTMTLWGAANLLQNVNPWAVLVVRVIIVTVPQWIKVLSKLSLCIKSEFHQIWPISQSLEPVKLRARSVCSSFLCRCAATEMSFTLNLGLMAVASIWVLFLVRVREVIGFLNRVWILCLRETNLSITSNVSLCLSDFIKEKEKNLKQSVTSHS